VNKDLICHSTLKAPTTDTADAIK